MFRDRFSSDLKDAMRAGEKLRVSTIRLMTSAVKSADIEARPSGKSPIDDTAIINVLAKMIKQRRDSAEQFAKGGRPEMAANELAEIALIEGYLPKQMTRQPPNQRSPKPLPTPAPRAQKTWVR